MRVYSPRYEKFISSCVRHLASNARSSFSARIYIVYGQKTCARGLNEVLLDREFKERLGRSIIRDRGAAEYLKVVSLSERW